MGGDLFMVIDRPLRKGNSECEWEKAEKIHNIESRSIMLDMLILYKFIVQSIAITIFITQEITFAEQL